MGDFHDVDTLSLGKHLKASNKFHKTTNIYHSLTLQIEQEGTADEGLGLPIHFSDFWVRFWTFLQTMTGSRSVAIKFLNIFKVLPGLRFMASLKQAADSWWFLRCRPHCCQHVNTNHSIWTSLYWVYIQVCILQHTSVSPWMYDWLKWLFIAVNND